MSGGVCRDAMVGEWRVVTFSPTWKIPERLGIRQSKIEDRWGIKMHRYYLLASVQLRVVVPYGKTLLQGNDWSIYKSSIWIHRVFPDYVYELRYMISSWEKQFRFDHCAKGRADVQVDNTV
jgi:hypothetical protein